MFTCSSSDFIHSLFSSESKCEISPCSVSDHDSVSFVFDIPDSIKHGPGVWNFNNSLLNDKIFCDRIQKLIEGHVSFSSCFPSIQDWWQFLKESIKESIAFARNKRRQLCCDEVLLTNRLIRLRQHLVDGEISVANSICDVESRLKALHEKRIQGIIVRSRAEWIEEGECPSCYFF